MAKIVRFSDLPIVPAEPGDTLTAYRDGDVARIPVPVPDDGGITSVGVSMPAGFQVANSPITSSGTITVTFAAGYGLPTTASMSQWSTAYSWGDHAQAGYADAANVNAALDEKVDKVAGKGLSSEDYTSAEKSKLSGIEAGATANATDAFLRSRANHTGTQSMSTVSGLSGALDEKVDKQTGYGLSQENFTTSEKSKLAGIAPGATANTGTVTSVGLSVPTGLSVSGSPVTSSGTLTVSYASGYSIPTNSKQNQWDQAYGWGNHASAGYALSSSLAAVATSGSYSDLSNKPTIPAAQVPADWNATSGVSRILNKPTLGTAAAANVGDFATAAQGANANTAYGWGDHASAGYASASNTVTTDTAQTITGQKTITSDMLFDGASATYVRPSTTGGWARGFWWQRRSTDADPNSRLGGFGAFGSGEGITRFFIGFGQSPWSGSGNTAEFFPSYTNFKYSLRVDGSEVWRANNFDPGTKVDTTDSRLTNAREWTASTVSQAEAQAGTATTVRKWTAQRVRQAIEAWWGTITLTKSDVGLGNVDNTADDEKTVYAFMVSDTRNVTSVPNAVPGQSALFEFKGLAAVSSPPFPAHSSYAHVLTVNGWTANGSGGWPTQVSWGEEISFRKGTSATTWGPWRVLATRTWVNAQLADLGGDVKNWIATTGTLTVNSFHKVNFSSSRTLTLPSSPLANDFVEIYADGGDATGSTIARNGATIMGLAENLFLDAPMKFIRLVYSGTTWRIAS